MNPIVEEMKELKHYGIKRRSGRYPWGSGDDPYQHSEDFLSRVEELKKKGWTETPENIKEEFGITTSQYRIEKALAKDERRQLNVARAKSLRDDGLNTSEIGRQMGVRESTVRSWFNQESEARMNQAKATADFLKKQVDEKGMIEVGKGTERELGISKEKLNEALYILEKEGYGTYSGGIPQPTNPGQQTTQKVLCPPHIKPKNGAKAPQEIYDYENIHTINDYISRDGGDTFEKKFTYPSSMDSSRMMIRYDEDGGTMKDGIVELRRNVPDLSLGESRYSQVRILVDDTQYIKGMAVYSDDMPDGVDVIFNTNKKRGTPQEKVLKKISDDPDNPFGSTIKDADQGGQYWYDADTGKRCSFNDPSVKNKKLGLINKRADEGDWTEWKDALPSQFLSKQSMSLAKKQLDLAKIDKQAEYDDICALNNPTIKKHLLNKFADECDSAAVHLQAAALPGQRYHVIVPVNSLKDNEVYAPGYEPGTKLALIRYPHGGTFEIPIVTVNNKNADAKKIIGTDPIDAICINKRVADRLSGADFDGDTVMCIPTHDRQGKVKISSKPALKELEGFDPKAEYGPDTYKGREIKYMTKGNKGNEMGRVSNLITDMTLAGASDAEIARAVRHSMVVIDAEKHKLDYKKSEVDNGIEALREKYQPRIDKRTGEIVGGGAATIISRAKGEATVNKRQGTAKVNMKDKKWYDPNRPEGALVYKDADDLYYPVRTKDKETGLITLTTTTRGKKVIYDPSDPKQRDDYEPIMRVDSKTGKVTFTNKSGTIEYKVKNRTQKSTKMMETDDPYTLVSDAKHPMELLYADYASSMKSLANRARKTSMTTGKIEYSKTAKTTYQTEVDSLEQKLNIALLNAGRERAALRKANIEVNSKMRDNPELKKGSGEVKKLNQQAVSRARAEVGAVSRRDRNIKITDREWEAIQAGAISETKLKQILNNTDIDDLRQRATPKTVTKLSTAKINKIKAMSLSNHTLSDIAKAVGVSPSTVAEYINS